MGIFSFLGKPEFYLEDVVKQNKEHPRTFLIPDKEEVDGLGAGSLVKLIFVMNKPLRECAVL
jgi:hypothetical protein